MLHFFEKIFTFCAENDILYILLMKGKFDAMEYPIHTISITTPENANTEMLFYIARARVAGEGLVRIELKYEDEQILRRVKNALVRSCNSLKRAKKILFALTDEPFYQKTTELSYLLNRYPELERDPAYAKGVGPYIVIKL